VLFYRGFGAFGLKETALPVDPGKWHTEPRPQHGLWDKPGGGTDFITQLLCVDDGKVLFEWSWSAPNPEKGKRR